MSELLNRKSAPRSSQVPFHVVSLIPGAGFQKHFTVSVLQSYTPFNVGVFQGVEGSGFSQNMCVLHQPAAGCAAQEGRWQCGLQAQRAPVDAAARQGEPLNPTCLSPSSLSPCLLPSLQFRPPWDLPQPVGQGSPPSVP